MSGEGESPHEEGCPFVPCERHLILEDLSPVTAPPPSCLGLGGEDCDVLLCPESFDPKVSGWEQPCY